MDYLIDTNVLLRFLNRADPHYLAARSAVRVLKSRGDTLFTGAQNRAEFWNVLTRPATARGGYGLTSAEADYRLQFIERLFPLLPESAVVYTVWRQLITTHAVIGVQVHDARIVALMTVHGVSRLLTLNTADFARYPGITAFSPQALLHGSNT